VIFISRILSGEVKIKSQICRNTANWLRIGMIEFFIPAEWRGQNRLFQASLLTIYLARLAQL